VRVALLTGPCAPGECGVGDYTDCLDKVLRAGGIESRVIASGDWDVLSVLKLSRSMREQNFDIVHIEYPTAGFGTSVTPQLLSLLRSCVVTIHEASQRHLLRKLSLLPFTVRAQHVIFTSEFEREFVTKWAPWIFEASSVIPVGSSIGMAARNRQRTLDEIVHFGLIIPHRGLEEVLELSRLILTRGLSMKVRIVGKVPAKHLDYLETLKSQAQELPVIWDLDLPEAEVAMRLAETSIAYLPYPDGVSERRTSLKAALLNGNAVITTRGAHTPGNLETVVRFAQTPEQALASIYDLMSHAQEITRMSNAAVHSAQRYTWERIAELHVRVYEGLLSGKFAHDRIRPAAGSGN